MTQPDRQTSRDEDLETIVDDLQENVTGEREGSGVPASEGGGESPDAGADEPTG